MPSVASVVKRPIDYAEVTKDILDTTNYAKIKESVAATPEAPAEVIERPTPGLDEAMRDAGVPSGTKSDDSTVE